MREPLRIHDDCRPVIRYRQYCLLFVISIHWFTYSICHNYLIWNYLYLGGFYILVWDHLLLIM